MKQGLIKSVISTSVSLLAFNVAASNLNLKEQFDLVPYVGADAQWRHMGFKKGYGDNITKKNYPQGNVYIGVKLNQYVGLEAGYERTTTVKKNTNVLGDEITLGTTLNPIDPTVVTQLNSKTKISAFYANVVGFLPICEEYRLQLIGSLGIARTRLHMTVDIPVLNNQTLSSADAADLHRVYLKKKWVPKIGVGLQHMFTCQLGVRAMLGWEGTARGSSPVRDIRPLNRPTSEFTARIKNSLNVGLGLFYNFK